MDSQFTCIILLYIVVYLLCFYALYLYLIVHLSLTFLLLNLRRYNSIPYMRFHIENLFIQCVHFIHVYCNIFVTSLFHIEYITLNTCIWLIVYVNKNDWKKGLFDSTSKNAVVGHTPHMCHHIEYITFISFNFNVWQTTTTFLIFSVVYLFRIHNSHSHSVLWWKHRLRKSNEPNS